MRKFITCLCLILSFSLCGVVLSSFDLKPHSETSALVFPYKQAGLTQRQAAAHLLSRFTFGARPGQVDEVVKMGLENWFRKQLEGNLPDDSLNQMLEGYDILPMSNEEISKKFLIQGTILRMAVMDGSINQDSVAKGRRDYVNKKLAAYMKEKGLHAPNEYVRQLVNQKILRATYSSNQLKEVLTSFWFNHFNVSMTKNRCMFYVLPYERDVIRPNSLGKFETLLLATAKSPAMLTYLDNFRSSSSSEDDPFLQKQLQKKAIQQMKLRQTGDTTMQKNQVAEKIEEANNTRGLNENYAREVMELHTLGVDGGYTQSDVTQAARILTGWTLYPTLNNGANRFALKLKDNENRFQKMGFVHDSDFFFVVNRHDKSEKKVLGTVFPAGGGYEEGVKLMSMLAQHPSTAKFISTKLATRFVNDNPPQSLIDKMAKTFRETNGDISKVLTTMVSSPEFWDKNALREKIKTPFELAISSVRSLNAEVNQPFRLFNQMTKMGERIYYYQAPTGFPDKGAYWINAGSVLYRMNFGLALGAQRIPGIRFHLPALNQNREPESAEAALAAYCRIMMPERNVDETVKRLTPMLQDPDINQKINAAASQANSTGNSMGTDDEAITGDTDEEMKSNEKPASKNQGGKANTIAQKKPVKGVDPLLAQVVGVIIGSPEFQRK